jgi:DNA primase catalytic core
MPRIPETEIERIKRETDLAALVRSRGVELRPHGAKDLAGKCPFHQEETASFIVTPAKGLFHCMGCGVAGNCIQFVQKFDGVSFRHAFELLNAGKAAFSPPARARLRAIGPTDTPLKKGTVPRLELPVNPEGTDVELMRQVVDYYHERLLQTPAALDYLKGRGIYSEEAVRRFKLGLADRTLGLRIPGMNRQEGAAIRTRLQKIGIYRANGREHMNGRIVLPIPGPAGRLKLYGRLFTKPNPGVPKHLFLPGPHEGIWNLPAIGGLEANGDLILCEAPFDALTFWVNGFKNVTFIYGTEGMTDEIFAAVLAQKVRRVYLAYDADDAGNRAAARDAERFLSHGLEVYRVKFPWGMDANEYAQKVHSAGGGERPAFKSLQILLNAAEWCGGSAAPTSKSAACLAEASRAGAGSSSILVASEIAADDKTTAKNEMAVNPVNPAVPAVASDEGRVQNSVPESPCLERQGEYHILKLGPREYRVGGLDKNNSLEVLKVAVRLRHGEDFHLDSFDMARDGERRRFIERAAEETRLEKDLIKRDLGKLLLLLEQEQSARISSVLSAKGGSACGGNPEPRTLVPELTSAEREEALAFLKSPDLVERIGAAFETCGLVGEETNRLAAYLACTSRKLDKPLAIIIQSTTAAGKSTVMEAVLAMFPEEERVKYSAMTGQSLYYLGAMNLKHKVLAIVEEEGAEKASYALKLLQSEGELTIASTGKDPQTGRMETQEYHVEGPVMIFLTTTAVEIDEELLNRCLIMTVDESKAQTERIHNVQRQARTLDGLKLRKRQPKLLTLLRNAQRLLDPVAIMNPYAAALTFPAELTRTRRDHEKYLTLMDAIALLHQHQRPRETCQVEGLPSVVPSAERLGTKEGERFDFVRVTFEDIALANRLAPELLGRSLDELPPQTRRLLVQIKAFVRARMKEQQVDQANAIFSRRELRRLSGWSEFQVRVHLGKLEALEYVARRWGRQGQGCAYELLTDVNEPDNVWHIGLLDVDKLRLSARGQAQAGHQAQPATLTPKTSCIPEGASCDFVNAAPRSATD